MTDHKTASSREERLAARLRENLKRRKVQARALGEAGAEQSDAGAGESADSPESALSNRQG
jgi:hypothetical protein